MNKEDIEKYLRMLGQELQTIGGVPRSGIALS